METEDEYIERISREFEEVINDFQKKKMMENTSMIRLLTEQINEMTHSIDNRKIDVKGN